MSDQGLPQFASSVRTIDLGALSVRLGIVQSFDSLLDHYANTQPSDVDRIPYFAQLWPSAVALAKYITAPPQSSALPRSLAGVRTIELGCGLGLPSIAAALLGADVLAVDFHPDNEAMFRRNAALNGLDNVSYRTTDWAAVSALGTFRLVLGSDLLYEKRSLGSLMDAMSALCAPGGMILLADPGRDAMQPVVSEMETRGFRQWTHVVDECFVVELTH